MPKKVSPSTIHKFRKKTSDLWFTCGASIKELVGKETSFDSLFIRNNLTCQRPVEAIYYKANYATCCSLWLNMTIRDFKGSLSNL